MRHTAALHHSLAMIVLAGLPVAGCDKPAPPATSKPSVAPAAAPAAPVAAPAAPAAPSGPSGSSSSPSGPSGSSSSPVFLHPDQCEVEMFGEFKLPKLAANQKAFAYVAQDSDCLAKDAHILGTNQLTNDGHMFIEVFSRWGADLTVCVAVATDSGAPSTYYGKAPGKFHAEGVGEVMIPKISFELKPGPKHVFPTPRPALPPPK
jgi:hypothetical protein